MSYIAPVHRIFALEKQVSGKTIFREGGGGGGKF